MSRRYGRVGQVAVPASTDAESLRRFSRQEVFERFSTKFVAALWVLSAILVYVYGRVGAALTDTTGQLSLQWALSIGWAAVGVVGAMFLYLTVYLPYIARIDLAWSVYVPWAVPTATAAGATAFLAFNIGLWPGFGLLTPAVTSVIGVGCLFAAHFVPNF